MIYGWDISTTNIGLVSFDEAGIFHFADKLVLKDIDGQFVKAIAFKNWVESLQLHRSTEVYHFVEERLGGFSGGRTSAQVLMKLAQFNAICSYILFDLPVSDRHLSHRSVMHLHPSSWKAIMKREGLIIPKGADKKQVTLDFVKKKEPRFENFMEFNRNDKPQPWCYDMADAYCIGKAGYHRLCTVKENSQL